jgi:hypothetical protein
MCHTMTLFRIVTCTDYDIRAPIIDALPRQWPRRFPTKFCSSGPRSRSRSRACKKDPPPFGQPFAVGGATFSEGPVRANPDGGGGTRFHGRSEERHDASGPDRTFMTSTANGRTEPSLPNAVPQHFASVENPACCSRPKADLQQNFDAAVRTLEAVVRAFLLFCWRERRSADKP